MSITRKARRAKEANTAGTYNQFGVNRTTRRNRSCHYEGFDKHLGKTGYSYRYEVKPPQLQDTGAAFVFVRGVDY